MLNRIVIVCLLFAVFLTGALVGCERPGPGVAAPAKIEGAVPRIISRGVIHAGYLEYPPGCKKDPNTGKLTGITVEALEQAAKNMGLRVEWTPASGWGSMIDDVRSQKVDLIGSPVWANSTRGKVASFSTPLFWSGICVYVRTDDTRFDRNLSAINAPDIRIATIDGEMSSIIAAADYSAAKTVALPESSDNSIMLKNVVDGKADVVFVEPYIANLFLASNPGKLRNITKDSPIRVFPNTLLLPNDDPALKNMIDTALNELKNSGVVDSLVRKHAPEAGSVFLDAKPYRPDGRPAD